ncbi:hypothetical protein GBAR_LOCUS15769, partial [Geodia barretti]
ALTQNKLKLHTDNSSGSSKYVCDEEHRLVPHVWPLFPNLFHAKVVAISWLSTR